MENKASDLSTDEGGDLMTSSEWDVRLGSCESCDVCAALMGLLVLDLGGLDGSPFCSSSGKLGFGG